MWEYKKKKKETQSLKQKPHIKDFIRGITKECELTLIDETRVQKSQIYLLTMFNLVLFSNWPLLQATKSTTFPLTIILIWIRLECKWN